MFSVLMTLKEVINEMQSKKPGFEIEITPLKSPQGNIFT